MSVGQSESISPHSLLPSASHFPSLLVQSKPQVKESVGCELSLTSQWKENASISQETVATTKLN